MKTVKVWRDWVIRPHKSIELQFELGPNTPAQLLGIEIDVTGPRKDHHGAMIRVSLLKVFFFGLTYYDHRHAEVYDN